MKPQRETDCRKYREIKYPYASCKIKDNSDSVSITRLSFIK